MKKAAGFVAAAVVAAGLVVLPQVGQAGSVSAQALVPDNAATSGITLELTPLAGSAPAVAQQVEPGEPVAFRSLPAGRYAVAISGLGPQLDATGLECSPIEAVTTVDEDSGVAVVEVAAGRDISCTFEAVPRGRIVVTSATRPAASSRSTQFDPSWTSDFELADDSSFTSTPLEPGTYSLGVDAPRGWTASDARCDDGSRPEAIGVDPGETVTCTVVTTQGGRIVLEHDATPRGQPAIFGFRTSWGEQLRFDARQTATSPPLPPGTYSLTRTRPPGWDLGQARCTGGQSPDRIALSAGETVTCRFTSQQRGRIVVVARTDAGTDATFAYRSSWGDPFELAADGTRTSRLLSPGTYRVRDRVPAGWVRGSATCSDGSTLRAIAVAPGETVTCTLDYGQPRFTVASFNVLGHSHTEPGGHSPQLPPGPARMETQMGMLRSLGVDVVGLQEFQPPQMDAFVRLSGGEYELYPGPQTPQQNKQNAVAWRTSVFDLVEARAVMIPYFNGNLVPMPLVKLRHRSTGLDVWVMSVHNPASIRKFGDQTRWRDAAMSTQIALTSQLVADGTPFIMTGDMNEREKYFCAYTASGLMAAAAGGSTGAPCQPPPASIARIDWIFGSRDIGFSDYRLIDDATVSGTSDHPLVLAEAVLGR